MQAARQWFIAVCSALAIGTFLLYLPVTHNDFINLDDGVYIYQNPHVVSGLNWQNIRWSFEHIYAGYWVPLTWISHMTDCQLFGLNPAAHHLVNVLIHAANAVLLFILLNYMTGAMWRSAFVAAAFAWHPLRVESVAWACERKDVLSGLFWILTLLCYARYARSLSHSLDEPARSATAIPSPLPSDGRGEGQGEVRAIPQSAITNPHSYYWLALLFFACGLMSKPMVVTLPFVLLLLDFWPLQRFIASGAATVSTFQRIIFEKIPFFALSLAECVATYRDCSAATANDPISFRLIHSFWGYLQYISKSFAPIHSAVLYPFPAHEPVVLGLVGAMLVLACSIFFTLVSRRQPYLLVGWLWFLGTLVPVIGIVQSGYQSMADRFTYLPCIGFFIVIAWGFVDLAHSLHDRRFLAAVAILWLAGCLVITSIQIPYWRNSITLFRRALAVTTGNCVACTCLGQALDDAGDEKDALLYCNEAVDLNPQYPPAQLFLGEVLSKTGDAAGALAHLNVATQLDPGNAVFQYKLGEFLLNQGKMDDAISRFNIALAAEPDFPEAHNAMGKALLKQGNLQKAADQLSQAVTLKPNDAQFRYDLGTVLLNASQTAQAIAQFSEAVRLKPDLAPAHENLAIALAREDKMADALEHFARAVELQPDDPEARFNLGFAYLNGHQSAQAAAQFSAELRLTPNEPKAHYRLAQALREQNEWEQSVAQYRQTLQLAPDFVAAKKEMDEILAAHPLLRSSSK